MRKAVTFIVTAFSIVCTYGEKGKFVRMVVFMSCVWFSHFLTCLTVNFIELSKIVSLG